MQTEMYTRKPFNVEAVRVTADNIYALAKWCEGNVVMKDVQNGSVVDYIQVDVRHPVNEKQTQAYVGDWLLFANKGWKIYTDKAFNNTFIPLNVDTNRPAPKIHVDERYDSNSRSNITGSVVTQEPVVNTTVVAGGRTCTICGTVWTPSPAQMSCPNASVHPGATA